MGRVLKMSVSTCNIETKTLDHLQIREQLGIELTREDGRI